MDLFFYSLAVIVCGGLVSIILPERFKGYALTIPAGLAMLPVLYIAIDVIFGGKPLALDLELSYPIGTVHFAVDGLSSFFLILISSMSFIGSLYAAGHLKGYEGKGRGLSSHYFFLTVLNASMLLLVTVQNALLFLVVWEIMSFSSFLLMIFENEKTDVFRAGINYLISMHVGVAFLLSGFMILSIKSGSYDFNSFKTVLEQGGLAIDGIFLLVFAGFGMKAGFLPLYTWLPGAYTAAPAHVSGIMSGIMKKTGIYGIFRIITLMKTPSPEIAFFVLGVSLLTGIIGVAYAVAQGNLKRVLAYSSVENIGIAGTGMGLGLLGLAYAMPPMAVLGFTGALFHVFNHSLFKPLLFFAAGNVYHKTKNLSIEKLGGLMKPMGFTGFSFLIGSLAVSGLPVFNGFIGEFIIYWSMLTGLGKGNMVLSVIMILSMAGLALIGAMALLCFTRVFSIAFLGSPRSDYDAEPEKPGFTVRAAMVMQMVIMLLIGLFPQYGFMFVVKIVSQLVPESYTGVIPGAANILGSLSQVLFLFLVIAALLFIARFRLLKGRAPSYFKTWDCGYQAGNTRMQYTGSSFAAPFLRIIRPIFTLRTRVEKPEGLFPREGGFNSQVFDRLEVMVIFPVINTMNRFLNAFTWIQSGSTQQYIMYGVLFLIAAVIWIMAA